MKPTRTSEIFAGFDPVEDPTSTKIGAVTKGDLASLGGQAHATIARLGAQDGVNVIRKVGGLSAMRFGIPDVHVERFRQLYDLAASIAPADLVAQTGLARELSNLVTDVLGAVPYLKWVVAVGQLIANLLDYASKRPDVPAEAVLSYSPDANNFALEALQTAMGEADWSPIFMPCQDQPQWIGEEIQNVEEMPGFMGKGMRVKAAGAMEDACDGMGLLPGLTEQDGGVYEWPFEMPPNPDGLTLGQGPVITGPGGAKGGRGWPTTPLNRTGSHRTLLRQASAALWQRIMRPGPETFMVDTTGMANAWARYYESLRAFPRDGAPGFEHQSTVQVFAATLGVTYTWRPSETGLVLNSKSLFSGLAYGAGRSAQGVNRIEVPVRPRVIKSLKDDLSDIGGIEHVVQQMVLRLYEMQWYTLSRYVVAYVDPNAPALHDSRLRERHVAMRSALLEHPAICEVEIGMIPDGDYRDAAQQAKERMQCFLGPQRLTANGAHRAPPPLDNTPEPDGAQGGPPGAEEGGGGGAAVVAAVIAAAAALLALG